MGRSSRNLKKRQKDKAKQENRTVQKETEQKLRKEMDEGQYAKAIETIAELIKAGDVQPEFMYDAAYSYFMSGDYDRAATWVTNTLSVDANHVDARILLGRLCVLQDRIDDGLAVFDFVLEHSLSSLSAEKKDEIEEIVSFYGRSDREKIIRNYPHVASFLKLESKKEDSGNKAADLLRRLKEKVAETNGQAVGEVGSFKEKVAQATEKAAGGLGELKEKVARASEKAVGELGETAKKNPKDILNTLRAKLDAIKEGAEEKTKGTAASEAEPVREQSPSAEASKETPAETMIRKVENQQVGAARKIEMLNTFAAGLYLDRDLKGAERLLKEALAIDGGSDFTLRNMALLQMELGNCEKALELASLMRQTDFLLLKSLQ